MYQFFKIAHLYGWYGLAKIHVVLDESLGLGQCEEIYLKEFTFFNN